MKKILSLGLCIAFVLSAILTFSACSINQDPNAIMTCSVNPEVQFVLNKNDQVIGVNYINSDAQTLLLDVNFVGMNADNAAKLFVQLSTEAGYISASTTGTKVEFTISCENDENMQQLKQNIVKQVNNYFDQVGIIAGAVASANTELTNTLVQLGEDIDVLEDKTTEEILNLAKEYTDELEGISVTLYNNFFTQLDTIRSLYNIDTVIAMIETYESQLKNSALNQKTKNEIQNQLTTAKSQLAQLQKQFDTALDSLIELLKTQSKAVFEMARTNLTTMKNANRQVLANHIQAYNADKEVIQSAIATYRQSLNA